MRFAEHFGVSTDYLIKGIEPIVQFIDTSTGNKNMNDDSLFKRGINAYFAVARRKGFTIDAIAGLFPKDKGITPRKIEDFQTHKKIPSHGEFFRMFDIFDIHSTESPPECHYMLARLYEIKREQEYVEKK